MPKEGIEKCLEEGVITIEDIVLSLRAFDLSDKPIKPHHQ